MSRLDQLYRRLLLTKIFTKGWGKPDNLKRLFDFRKIISNRELCRHLVADDYPIHIDKEYPDGDNRIIEGHFLSPLALHLPGIVPKEVETATFQIILPSKWKDPALKPMCIHLAGTGDHFFWRRRLLMAKPLLKEYGIASILLENPYYGARKPKGQIRSSLHNVSDLFVMGGALILESLALLHWCQKQGYGPLGLTGISMGGHMASLAATNWHEPLSLIPCLSWTTASIVFTQGVLSGAISWKTLETQFFENSIYQDELSHLIVSPEDHQKDKAYWMGQQFVKDFSQNYDKLQEMHHHFLDDRQGLHPHTSVSTPANHRPSLNSLMQASVGTVPFPTGSVFSKAREKEDRSAGSSALEPDPALQLVQPAISSLTHPPSSDASTLKVLTSSSSSLLGDSLSLKHAVSKAKLSRTGGQPASGTRQSKLSRWTGGSRDPSSQSHTLQEEAVNFMVGVMDECTHLGNFSIPLDPSLIIIVAAQKDAYIPRHGVTPLNNLWPGSELRYLSNRGHITAALLNTHIFRKAIADSFDRQIKLYYQR